MICQIIKITLNLPAILLWYITVSDQLAHYLAKEAPNFVATLYKKVLELKTAKLMSASFTSAKKRTLEPGEDEEFGNDEKPPG